MTVTQLIPSGFQLHVNAAELAIIRKALAPKTLGDPGLVNRSTGAVPIRWTEEDYDADAMAAIYGTKGA